MEIKSPRKFGSIQALRAIAANMVVISHLAVIEVKYGGGYAILPESGALGRLGVHIFFVISGFVIALVVAGGARPGRFLWDRVTRIYPIYWIYTAVILGIAVVAPGAVNSSFGEIQPSVLKSLLLWPDAQLPWLAVGWSLVHEMYFYLVVALILALRINFVAGLLIWGAVIALPIQPTSPELTIMLSPMTYEFIAGALLGTWVTRLHLPSWPPIPWLERLGDASYSVYLSHVLVMSAMGRVFGALPWHGWVAEALFVIACLVGANLWGWLSYRFLERPMMSAARMLRFGQPKTTIGRTADQRPV